MRILNLFRRKPKRVPISHQGKWRPTFHKVVKLHIMATTVRR